MFLKIFQTFLCPVGGWFVHLASFLELFLKIPFYFLSLIGLTELSACQRRVFLAGGGQTLSQYRHILAADCRRHFQSHVSIFNMRHPSSASGRFCP